VQNTGEAQQNRWRQILRGILRQLIQIDFSLATITRPHYQMALRIDIEIPAAPVRQVISTAGILYGPICHQVSLARGVKEKGQYNENPLSRIAFSIYSGANIHGVR
jgi:hypothetical protein